MGWITTRELRRLERELATAKKRADDAEDRLAAERASKDWLTLQLASRIVTKGGGYGLDHDKPVSVQPQSNPKGFIREPTYEDEAKLEFYKQCAVNAGRPVEDAIEKWELEMRGQSITYTEQEQ